MLPTSFRLLTDWIYSYFSSRGCVLASQYNGVSDNGLHLIYKVQEDNESGAVVLSFEFDNVFVEALWREELKTNKA